MPTEQELRQELVDIVGELFDRDMITSTGGNVSARIPDEEDAFLITPTRLHKGGLTPDLIVKVNSRGKAYNRRQRPSVRTPPSQTSRRSSTATPNCALSWG